MYQNPQINDNDNAPNNDVIYVPQEPEPLDNYSNVLQQPSSNILCNELNAGFSASDNVLHDVTMPPTYPSNEMQYNCSTEQAPIQYPPQSVMNTPPAVNSPQIQTNDSEIFRFNIPGFHIIILPISSPLVDLNNLDLQYQLQQDQLNQEQSYVSNVSGGGSSISTQSTLVAQHQHQHQYDQQLNYLESFNNYNF